MFGIPGPGLLIERIPVRPEPSQSRDVTGFAKLKGFRPYCRIALYRYYEGTSLLVIGTSIAPTPVGSKPKDIHNRNGFWGEPVQFIVQHIVNCQRTGHTYTDPSRV